MSSRKEQIRNLEVELKIISKQIEATEKEKAVIDQEIENAELEVELAENEMKYYDILIKELVEEYGVAGEEILAEIAPDILQELKANHTLP